MKLPQLALQRVSSAPPVMTVCDSSVLAALPGNDAKRDAGRLVAPPIVTLVASGHRVAARFYKRLSLCTRLTTRAGAAGALQIGKTVVFAPFGALFPHGMRAAPGLSDGSCRQPDFCQIGDWGT
jgi:hypothetical protein